MKPAITLTRALADVELFGKVFASPSYWPWKVIAKLIDGEPLREPREVELFQQCTGRTRLPTGPMKRLIILVGRRGGKDRFLSAVAVWRAALCADWRKHISVGEQAVCILLGADKKQGSILSRYCAGLLQQPMLAAEVTRQTNDVIEFANGASLEIATNDARLVRGRSAIAVLGSECAYWKTDEYSQSSDEEVVAAAEPSMAMTPDGGVLLLGSSVHRKKGYMFRQHRELFGNDGAEESLCWFAPSPVMNPRLPAAVIEKALAKDGPRARAEYLNEWRSDLSDFIPLDVIESCTDFGVYERPPVPGVEYIAHCDAAGGTGADSFTLAIAHRGAPHALDVVRERKPRFVPAAVIAEFAQILKAYKITEIQGDKFAGGFHASEWSQHGITFTPCENTTSENYLAALPVLLAGRVRLIDNATLRSQLSSLERRVGAADRESVSHPQHASAHDDVATSACGAIVAAAAGRSFDSSYSWVGSKPGESTRLEEYLAAMRTAQLYRAPSRWRR